jgi:hypothetical protein
MKFLLPMKRFTTWDEILNEEKKLEKEMHVHTYFEYRIIE